MTNDSSFPDPRPRSWLDAFPWLKGAADSGTDTWWNDVIDDTDEAVRRQRSAQISELAMAHLTQWTIEQIFPGLAPDVDLHQLQLPARAINALIQHDCSRAGDLAGITLDGILGWRQVGVGTVDAILQGLADASASVTTPAVMTDYHVVHSAPQPQVEQVRLPKWMSTSVDDLSQIATWYATIGLPGQPLLGTPLPPGAPEEILRARQRLEALRGEDILVADERDMDVAGLLDEALRLLDPRAAQILSARLFADNPVTLDEIGKNLGVTRERVRQIEGKARGAVLGFLSDGGPLELVAEAVRGLIGTIRPLDDLVTLIPALRRTVDAVGQPAWRVLDRLDDAYEIADGWCVAPTMTAARTITQTLLQERADKYGVVRLDSLDLIEASQLERLPELTASWLTHCSYINHGDFVLTRTQSVGDYGAAILSVAGTPLSAQEIVDRFIVERSSGSLRNAMSQDDRFERVDRDRWALSEWGMDSYAGVRSLIREQVARGGGHVGLNDLIEYITGKYSVTASSVVAYASSPPFENRDGIVRLAAAGRESRKSPARTRRLFRHEGAWAYRVRITKDHLRGSGFVAPMAIASILGLQFGQTRQLESPLGPQAVSWTGTQPSFGTIRRFLMDSDTAADTDAFVIVRDDGSFTFDPARELAGDALTDALSLIGAPGALDVAEAREALAKAIGLPKDSPVTSVIGGYRERGDSDIADLLTGVRDILETGHHVERVAPTVDVDEIMDLL
ncbi:sigma factor-like helix-turn-helix DNA-binding protein [Kitasatospora sp. NPDC101157]|uniref:sigma factor-like helix-turn-helix DNA-binding protein n=1 Tax=Kitasatospora sp. NPDC101157 TaxID=3364098 RepID=UPI0037F19960